MARTLSDQIRDAITNGKDPPALATSVYLGQYCQPGIVNVNLFQMAINDANGKVLEVEPGATYIFPSQITITSSLKIFCRGRATFKLQDGAIVNTDSSATNYQSIIQVRGCSWFVVEGIDFDGNRNGQTYPATVNTFGRGSRPFRHNALLEFVPSDDNLTASKNILVTRCGFRNAYMSGIALWQAGYHIIENSDFENNTWSGLVGCGLNAGGEFRNNRGLRNGVSTVYDVHRQTGDRATYQVREYDPAFTASIELIPTINTGSLAQFSNGLNIYGNQLIEDQVEGIFVRGAFHSSIYNNRILNVGYQRVSDGGSYNGTLFNPAAIWFEWGSVKITNNDIVQTSPNTGWMLPDGIVCFSFEGDGSTPITMDGVYQVIVSNNNITCDQAYNSGNAYTTDSEKRVYLYRGIRSNGNALMNDNVINGASSYPILITNDGNYNSDLPKRVTIRGGRIHNFTGDGAIFVTRFGSPTGNGGNFVVDGTNIFDGRSQTAGSTRGIVLFDTNLDGQAFDLISITNNIWDCSNSADSTLTYYGFRHRGASTSKLINITGNSVKDCFRLARLSGGASIVVNSNNVDGCSRFLEINQTGNIGSLVVNGNLVANMTFALFDFTYTGSTIARMTITNNLFQGTGNRYLNNFDPAQHTIWIVQPNLLKVPNSIDVRRTVSGAPTGDAMYVGEILWRTDTSRAYIAINVGSGASDWSLLA